MVSHDMIQARMQEEIDDLRAALAQPDTEMPKTLCGPNLEEVLNAAGYYKRKPLTDEVLKAEFAKIYKSDAAILHLAENNKNYALESIGARHHWTAFESGARAIERAHGIE